MPRVLAILLCSLLMLACDQPTTPSSSVATGDAGDPPTTTSTTVGATTTVGTDPSVLDSGANGCFTGEPELASDGFLGRNDATDSDAQNLAGINWTDSGDCAAVTLSFRTAPGAPAVDPPAYRAEYLRHTGVVRVELGEEVADSVISDQVFDTDLLDTAYIAFDPVEQTLVADVHVAGDVTVRIRSATAPARLVLEFERSGRGSPATPEFGRAIVLFQPASERPPMTVEGYGRAGLEVSASVVSSARSQERTIVFADSPTRWTIFEWTIRDFQPGPVAIRVGDAPPIEFISQ